MNCKKKKKCYIFICHSKSTGLEIRCEYQLPSVYGVSIFSSAILQHPHLLQARAFEKYSIVFPKERLITTFFLSQHLYKKIQTYRQVKRTVAWMPVYPLPKFYIAIHHTLPTLIYFLMHLSQTSVFFISKHFSTHILNQS